MKDILHTRAVRMRKKGASYSEILKKIPVARSTLSLWLRAVGLSKRHHQRLTKKRLAAAKRGGAVRHHQRILEERAYKSEARKKLRLQKKLDLWLAGILLYWAEGSKIKTYRVSQGTIFANSDPRMIRLFVKWLLSAAHVNRQKIYFELFIHEGQDEERFINFWSKQLGCDRQKIRVYFKRNQSRRSYSHDSQGEYYGLIRVRVRQSVSLNRRITSWIDAVCDFWRVAGDI